MLARAYSVKIGVIFGVRFERRKVDKKQTYMKTETCKLYSRDFWIFLPNIIKIDHCNSELYPFSQIQNVGKLSGIRLELTLRSSLVQP